MPQPIPVPIAVPVPIADPVAAPQTPAVVGRFPTDRRAAAPSLRIVPKFRQRDAESFGTRA